MKTFSEWLCESHNNLSYDKNDFESVLWTLQRFALHHDHDYEPLRNDIYDGKKDAVRSFFAPLDEPLRILQDRMKEQSPSLQREAKEAIINFTELRKGYKKMEQSINGILSCVRKGEKEETALPKIAKMTKNAMFYDIRKLGYTDEFFDEYSVDDLKDQIEQYNGTIKLNGVVNLYINFKNGNVNFIKF